MKKWIACYLLMGVFVLVIAPGCNSITDKEIRDIVSKEIQANKQQNIQELSEMLFPLYTRMNIKFNKDAKNYKELLEPLFIVMEK